MKKRVLIITTVLVAALLVAGCGKSDSKKKGDKDKDKEEETKVEETEAPETSQESLGAVEIDPEEDASVGMEKVNSQVIFTVSRDLEIEEDAWLGVVPTGKVYKTELEADDEDIVYTYAENYLDETNADYRFVFDEEYFFSFEDGTYDMVLCSSDNGDIGKVLIQVGIEKTGNNVVIDYANEK